MFFLPGARSCKGGTGELQFLVKLYPNTTLLCQQGTLQEKEDSEPGSALSPSPSIQEWLAQARTTRSKRHQDSLQRQRELEEQLAEQKKLLQSVASRGEELLTQQTAMNGVSEKPESVPQEGEKLAAQEQMRQKWESLNKEFITKQQLLQNTLQQDHSQPVYSRPSRVSSTVPVFKGEPPLQDKSSVRTLFSGFNQAFEDVSSQAGGVEKKGLDLELRLYNAVCASSSWLDGVENSLFAGPVLLAEDAETQLCNQEVLSTDIREVTEDVDKNRDLFLQAAPQCGENQDVIEETLCCLQERLSDLDSAELKMLFTALADSKYLILHKLAEAMELPAAKQMEAILESEESLKEFEQRINELKTHGQKLQPDQPAVQELLELQDTYEELVLTVGSRRSGLNQSLALKGQCERALQDLADLVDTAQDKMAADQKIIAMSKEEVQNRLDKHKEFFQGLESHMILTKTFFQKICSFALPRQCQSHDDIMAQVAAVLKKAHKRGVELEYILETWTRLEEDYQCLYRQLEVVESSIPSVGLVEETEERLTERIALYQRLKTSLTEHQHQLYQVLDDGKRLLMSVCCSDLENQLTQLGEHWLNNTTRVNKELQRLDTILEHWTRYQSESAELDQWLQSALNCLEFWTTQSVTVPQELETVRDHLNAFLVFSKEVDSKSSLKSSVLSTGNQLLRLKKVDTAGLHSGLAQTDSQWTELLTRIPVVLDKLHQLQMEKLPSHHAITELMSWITLMENTIEEDEESIKGVIGSQAIREYLQKYKGFKIDMNCKQLTVDFVNQSVLQISSQDVESKRSDKTDFAERLGAMNNRWQVLQSLITEKSQLLDGLLDSWLDYESSVQSLNTWLNVQEERMKKQYRIEDLASVQNALKDCQELEDMINVKEKDVVKVEERGCSLIQNKKDEACAVVMETLQGLNHSWANLDHLIGQLKISLKSVLDQWNVYKKASEEINGYLMEGRYSLSRFRLLTGSLEAVQVQVDNLQNLQDELEKQESRLRKFGAVTHQLLLECHPSVSDTLNNTLKDVNLRWNCLLEEIVEQLHSSKALLQLWQRYKEYYSQCSSAVLRQEERTNELLKTATSKDIADDEVSAWIQDCSDLLKAQKAVQDSLYVLHELGEQLHQQVDSSAVAAIQSDRISMSQRLKVLEQALTRQQGILQAGVQDFETFSRQLEALEGWIVEAEDVLKGQDPNRSTDLSIIQNRMEELKRQMLNFSSMSPDMERLNELGYRLPLNDKQIKGMQTLNRSWSVTSSQTTERFSKLQAFLLQHQTFLEKCETWMEFLVQTEEKLAVEISGNYQSLLEQQRAHELFQAEMFSRQQILHSIISDGQHLLEQGQVDDRDEFNLKLALLSNQWQGVIRRAQQRRGIIDSLIRQWQRYREMAEKLRKWLVEVSHQEVGKQDEVPVQQARAMLDEVQLKEKVLQRQQGSYILTVEAGKLLLLSADSEAEATLQAELTEIQERWKAAHVHLDKHKRELAALLRDWERCEKGIGDSLEKLRAFKRKLSQPLPDHHDELHTEQIRCKLSLRRQQVSEKLNEWGVFNEKNKELCEWLTQMEGKVSQNGDISIEEMIEKLRKDYQEEISVAQENKVQLQQMGDRLAKASHESKAAEIEHNLSKVNDRWQHLLDLIGARVKKLRETLVTVQQLDKNMSNLRSWLAHIETELSKPIVYETSDSSEIQRKLNEQQDLQRDIEKHSTGVASVLNLCEVLLHDCDACATDTECDSIQQATRSLDRRWRNICAMSMERRLKEKKTRNRFFDDVGQGPTLDRIGIIAMSDQQIRRELLESQLKVASLQDMSSQLLVNTQGTDCLEAKEKVHVIGNRLKLLLKEVTRDLRELERTLGITVSQPDLSSWSSADELDTCGSLSPNSGSSTPSRRRSVTYNSFISNMSQCGGSVKC
ncbi:UNVERIFIED_CONTAM: hypothetical protein FKN15_004424 [Acipenser sinensis]